MLGRLEILSNLMGASGDEQRVRRYIKETIKPDVDEMRVDHLGNLYAYKHGKGPVVMVTAHMDEVGLQIRGALEDGLLAYDQAGIDPRVVVSKRVLIGDQKIPGVIGAKAHHMQKKSDFEHVLDHDELFIDIGAKDRADAMATVKVGDYACFATQFAIFGENKVKGKALDDRIGCAILMELLKNRYDCEFVAVFATQEEVGSRGSTVAVERVKPDVCLVLEGTTANDMPDVPINRRVTEVGKGAAISFMDRGTIVPERMRKALVRTAEEQGIPYQLRRGTTGGNDASVIHKAVTGCVTGCISVGCRYIHSPCSVADVGDIQNACRLADAFLFNQKWNEVLIHG